MAEFGYWALLPPIIAIGAAIATRKVYLSLTLGILAGALIFERGNMLQMPLVFVDWLLQALVTNIHVVVFTLLLGCLIALMAQAGGMKGFARWAMPRARTPRLAQFYGWFLGTFIVFIDDYFDTITVGTVMRPITDRQNVSREKLAYIVDSTAAPVAIIVPISTWVGVIVGYIAIQERFLVENAFTTFLLSIPFNFYSFVAIVWALLIIVSRVEYGPMKKAEERARETGALLRPGATPLQAKDLDEIGDDSDAPPRMGNLVLPILVLVLVAVVSMWGTGYSALRADGVASPTVMESFRNADSLLALVLASLIAVAYAGVMFVGQRVITVEQFFHAMEVGFKAMMPAIMVLALAWTIGIAIDSLGLGTTMAALVSGNLSVAVIPALIFLLGAFIAFATGTSFGTFAILLPIAIPIGAAIDPVMIPVLIAATIGGSVFGDHASPISDTTVLSSMASACDHVDHVRTQLPYAGAAAGVSLAGYLMLGSVYALSGDAITAAVVAGLMILVGVGGAFGLAWVLTRRRMAASVLAQDHAPADLGE